MVLKATFPLLLLVSVFNLGCILAEFKPDVRWTCASDYVSIFVRTEQPFQGLITPRGVESDDCQTHGDGANVAALRLPLTHGKCGIVFDPAEDSFHLSVDVRSHPVLIVENDKNVNITCRPRSQQKKSASGYFLDVFDGNLTTSHLRYAAPYKLRVSGTLKQNFSVGPCVATAGGNSSVQLTDRRGCSLLPNLVSHFTRTDSAMVATLPSMFRFPNSNTVTLNCKVDPCDGNCEDIDCQKPDNSVASLLDGTTVPADIDDDSQSATLTITVVEKVTPEVVKAGVIAAKDETAAAPPTAEPQCARPADMDALYALCIILSVSSAIFFTINVCFCCILWRRNKKKPRQKSLIQQQSATAPNDFWIMEQKPAPPPLEPVADDRRISTVSYASVKKPRRAHIPTLDHGMSTSRASDTSSGYGGEIYRRPENTIRHSSSTFMTPSVTMETDLDSSISSNQTSSYH